MVKQPIQALFYGGGNPSFKPLSVVLFVEQRKNPPHPCYFPVSLLMLHLITYNSPTLTTTAPLIPYTYIRLDMSHVANHIQQPNNSPTAYSLSYTITI